MTIKKRLVLSNIGMIVIPIMSFFLLEVLFGFLLFFVFDNTPNEEMLDLFITFRFAGLLLIIVVTNGLLTYLVSKSILKPLNQLMVATKKIAEGNLEFSMDVKGKDEISQLSKNFETMRRKLKETKELNDQYETNRKELIASISHDLKTPITSIKGYMNGIRDGVANTPEKMDKYMKTITNKANELEQLIDELFLYSKLNLKKEPFHLDKLDLNAYLKDYLEELQLDMEERGGVVRFHVDTRGDYHVLADREKINRVINNLIENSLKYMDKDKKVLDVVLSDVKSDIKVEIRDNGSGISEDSLQHIFEQFYRTDASRNSSTGGSGIGLAIVKQIIEVHSGTVWAESEEGKGTSIYFTLPKVGD